MKNINQSCVVFVGAGASVTAGIPTAQGFIDSILDDNELKVFVDSEDEYFEMMQKIAPNDRKRLFNRSLTNARINETHLILASLIHLGFIDTVITTNFDPLVEKSLGLFHHELNVIDITNNLSTAGQQLSNPALYYLHGKHSNVWQLNTKFELDNKRVEISHLLSELIKNRILIVVGYSGNDPVFEELCKFENFGEGLFWVGYKSQNPSKKVKKKLLDHHEKEVYLISGYDSDNLFRCIFDNLVPYNQDFSTYISQLISLSEVQESYLKKVYPNSINVIESIKFTNNCSRWIKNQKIYTHEDTIKDKPRFLKNIFGKDFYLNIKKILEIYLLKKSIRYNLQSNNFEAALETVNTAIYEDPSNYIAHFYKGVVLSSQAESIEDPSEREEYYARAKDSYDTARTLMEEMEETPVELEELNNTVVSYWADEYNMAVNIQNDDSLFNATEDPYRTSLTHLQNAVTINPDSAMTYQVLSSTHFQLEQIDQAIATYEQAMERMEEPEASDYEYLTSLYLYDSQYEKAITMAEDALERYPGNSMFVQFMADAYIKSGERDRAIEIVQDLIDEEPYNPQYRRVLGTQIYQSVEELGNEASDMYEELFELRQEVQGLSGEERAEAESRIEDLTQEIDEIEVDIDELTQISVEQMEKVIELEPESESANFILGIIYQNRAANLFERRNNTTDNAQANEYDTMAIVVLRDGLVYYERAAEINPDNPENWQSLFQVYTTLGMEEKAAEAKRKESGQ